MLKTDSKQYLRNVKKYLKECIDKEDIHPRECTCDKYCSCTDFYCRIRYIFKRCRREYSDSYYILDKEGLKNWLVCLPIAIDYIECNIKQVYYKLHETKEIDDKTMNDMLENWLSNVASWMIFFRRRR